MSRTSNFWCEHFEQNLAKQRIDWTKVPRLTDPERRSIIYSLKAWQLGETSDGRHLLAAARNYAGRMNDPEYVQAVTLFIKEEQKHGSNLGRYIDLIGEQRAKRDLGDTLFRKVRYMNTSMEAWTIAVIIVESAAQLFYKALHDATGCDLLRAICSDILLDEAHHIKFQNERLWIIFQRKGFYSKTISLAFYSILFFGTIHAIWYGHHRAFRAGGVDRNEFMRGMCYKFFNCMRSLWRRELVRPELRFAVS